jgi:hypothetical protein
MDQGAARPLLRSAARGYPKIFRIQIDPSPEGLRCRLSGRLDAESTEIARSVLAGSAGLRFADLSELGPVDDAGLGLLAALRGAEVELEGLSPYLALRLETLAGAAQGRPGGAGR